jgi:hypothetical protein
MAPKHSLIGEWIGPVWLPCTLHGAVSKETKGQELQRDDCVSKRAQAGQDPWRDT